MKFHAQPYQRPEWIGLASGTLAGCRKPSPVGGWMWSPTSELQLQLQVPLPEATLLLEGLHSRWVDSSRVHVAENILIKAKLRISGSWSRPTVVTIEVQSYVP